MKQNDILQKIKENISEIENEFSRKQIKDQRGTDTLSYDMGIAGHMILKRWDKFDLYYRAGQIVLIKNHIFNYHDSDKLTSYMIMRKLDIPFDYSMRLDCIRAIKRKRKYGYDNLNIESRIRKRIELILYNVFGNRN